MVLVEKMETVGIYIGWIVIGWIIIAVEILMCCGVMVIGFYVWLCISVWKAICGDCCDDCGKGCCNIM